MVEIATIKTHLRENKKVYIVGGSCLIVGMGVGALYMGGGVQIIDAFKLINWKSPHWSINMMVRRGHPGDVVKCLETGEIFASQNRAAITNGINQGEISRNIRGLQESAGGLHFVKLGEAPATIAK